MEEEEWELELKQSIWESKKEKETPKGRGKGKKWKWKSQRGKFSCFKRERERERGAEIEHFLQGKGREKWRMMEREREKNIYCLLEATGLHLHIPLHNLNQHLLFLCVCLVQRTQLMARLLFSSVFVLIFTPLSIAVPLFLFHVWKDWIF